MEKKAESLIYSTDWKNKANKMFIIWLPIWGKGNKCKTTDLTDRRQKIKVLIGSRKQ